MLLFRAHNHTFPNYFICRAYVIPVMYITGICQHFMCRCYSIMTIAIITLPCFSECVMNFFCICFLPSHLHFVLASLPGRIIETKKREQYTGSSEWNKIWYEGHKDTSWTTEGRWKPSGRNRNSLLLRGLIEIFRLRAVKLSWAI